VIHRSYPYATLQYAQRARLARTGIFKTMLLRLAFLILVREGWCEPTFDVPGVIPQPDRWF
jgi:hypothetical protein